MARKYTLEERRTIYTFKKCSKLICKYCKTDLSNIPFNQVTVDHKTPLARGGETIFENLAISCRKCNEEKANKTEKEYLIYIDYKKTLDELADNLQHEKEIKAKIKQQSKTIQSQEKNRKKEKNKINKKIYDSNYINVNNIKIDKNLERVQELLNSI